MSSIAIRDLSPPIQQVNLDLDALKTAFAWLFNATAAGIPMPYSVAQYFWSASDQLDSEYWSMEVYQLFQSLLAFPFWHFNDNNFGNVKLKAHEIVDSLPAEFYTYATVDKPMSKIQVDRGMFIAFCILQIISLSCIWTALICRWIWHRGLPRISSYPVVDFAMKTQQGTAPSSRNPISPPSGPTVAHDIIDPSADDARIRRVLRDQHTFIRRTAAQSNSSTSTISLVQQTKNPSRVALLAGMPSPQQ